MRSSAKLISAFIALCMAASVALQAQNGTMTPYSRYGYGILNDNVTAAQRSMGGVGYAMNSGRQINVMNPASYANADSLTMLFDMGINMTTMWQEETVNGKRASDKQTGGGLDYITMQFPITKWLGASIGLLPFTSVGYTFGNEIENGAVSRQGSGSFNQLYGGLGAKIFKGFTVGANFAYLFGSTFNDSYAYTSSGSTTLFQRELEIRDWRMDIGVQYSRFIGRKNRFTIGLVYSPEKDLRGNAIATSYDMGQTTTPESETTPMKGNYSMPATWGGGIAWEWNSQLLVEADVTYQPWSKAKFAGAVDVNGSPQFDDRWKVGLGAQYTPKVRGNFVQRIQYRVGAFVNHDYLKVMGNNVREHGAAFGFGLPISPLKTVISIGVEWRHRQANPSPLIKEDYICLSLGMNINEMWFRKSKIY